MADLTDMPLRQALLRLSVPIMGSMLLETLFNFVNGYWVGHLGTEALAAVNLSSFSVWLLFALAGIVATGTNANVAQQLGARRPSRARRVARLGILAAALLGLGVALPMRWAAAPFLRWQAGAGGDVQGAVELGAVYLKTMFAFAPIFCVNETCSSILRARGDTRTPLRVYGLGFGINFILDPLLILGVGPFPRLGVWGAALASGLSFTCIAALYSWLMWTSQPVGWTRQSRRWWQSSAHWLGRIVRIGLPPSLSSMFFCLVYMFIAPVVGSFGPAALAALGVGHRVESLGYLICYGFSLASITLVGQNVGAGQGERARQAGWEACRVGSLAMAAVAVWLFTCATPLARIFSDDELVIAYATDYLRVIALGQVPMGLHIILQGVFSGAGRPLPPTVLSMLSASLRVPLANLFALRLGYGLNAVWGVIAGLCWLHGTLTLAVFWLLPGWLLPAKGEPPR